MLLKPAIMVLLCDVIRCNVRYFVCLEFPFGFYSIRGNGPLRCKSFVIGVLLTFTDTERKLFNAVAELR